MTFASIAITGFLIMIIIRKLFGYSALPNTQFLYKRLREPDNESLSNDFIEMTQFFTKEKNQRIS